VLFIVVFYSYNFFLMLLIRYISKVTWQLKDHFNLELHKADIFMPLMEQGDNRPYLYSETEPRILH